MYWVLNRLHEHYQYKPEYHQGMYIIPLAWLYVALMMALAEANSTQGSLLGAVVTFFIYGVLPVSILVYLMGTPLRRRQRLKQEAMQAASIQPDTSSHAPSAGDLPTPDSTVPPVREKP